MRTAREPRPRRPRFVHLGERLAVVHRIRSGVSTAAVEAEALGVTPDEVTSWLESLANDRTFSLSELREGSAELSRLSARAQRLATLLAESERTLRDLHQEYLRAVASNESFVDPLQDEH